MFVKWNLTILSIFDWFPALPGSGLTVCGLFLAWGLANCATCGEPTLLTGMVALRLTFWTDLLTGVRTGPDGLGACFWPGTLRLRNSWLFFSFSRSLISSISWLMSIWGEYFFKISLALLYGSFSMTFSRISFFSFWSCLIRSSDNLNCRCK